MDEEEAATEDEQNERAPPQRESEPKGEQDSGPEQKQDKEPVTEPAPAPEQEPEQRPQTEPERGPEGEPVSEPEPEPELQPEAEEETETEQEQEQELEPESGPVPESEKTEKKKGSWKTIGHEPISYELYPCLHRWRALHPRGPCIQYKQVRWILLPLSERIAQLALPLLRRLLALWLEYGDKFPPEMRSRLMKSLTENYGLTEEFLEQILEEAKRAREVAEKRKLREKSNKVKFLAKRKKGKKSKKRKKTKKGKKGKKSKKNKKRKKSKKGKKGKKGKKKKHIKKKGKKKGKKKKSKKKKKEKKAKSKKTKQKEKKEKESGLLFKRRKPGKLPLDWPYKMGSKFLLNCIALLSKDPDEDYNSRASEYFDVQAMAILEEICRYMEMPLPDPEKPTQYGETLVIMALNLSDWIAKYVTTPAQAIPDDKVEEYLKLRGAKPKPPKVKKPKKARKPSTPKKKKKKKDNLTESKPPSTEPVTEVQRNWQELKAPVFVPEKSRISKRKPLEEQQAGDYDGGYASDAEHLENANDQYYEGVPRWLGPTLEDVKKEFLEYINWYNPWEPEFMYSGPRLIPKGVNMFKIWDPESDEVPSDYRALNWNQIEYGFCDNYSFVPSPVPQYYPALRPLRPIRLENVEMSGIPKEATKRNLRLFSPWYLMKKPLKPPPPTPPYTQELETMGEFEENMDDEILMPEKKPQIKDSVWGDCTMREQLEILGHLIHVMSSVPDLTIEYVFEVLEEFCEAVSVAEADENSTEENILLRKKRTIILEQYFFAFFGKKFRDYNEKTPEYMRVLCSRCAYYIQILYEYTARILWELQSRPNLPTPIPTPPETPDDPESLRNLDEWLDWLMTLTKTCDQWAGWISETVTEAERKAVKKKGEFIGPNGRRVLLTADEWFDWKADVEKKITQFRTAKKKFVKESPIYLERSKTLVPVKHRHKVCKQFEEFFGEEEEEEEEVEEDEEEEEMDKVEEEEEEELEELEVEYEKEEEKYQKHLEENLQNNKEVRIDTDDETEWEDVGEGEN